MMMKNMNAQTAPVPPHGFALELNKNYKIKPGDMFYSRPHQGWETAQGVIGMCVRDLFYGNYIAKPAETGEPVKPVPVPGNLTHRLSLRIASALQPQMSADAKNGNATARAGIVHLAGIVKRELAEFKISSHDDPPT